MSLQLTDEELRTISLARKNAKLQIWIVLLLFGFVTVTYFGTLDGVVEVETFSNFAFIVTVLLSSRMLLQDFPMQAKLVGLIERLTTENSNTFRSAQATENGT